MFAAGELIRLRSTGPAAHQFLAEVNRILEEGSARQETSEEMTGKIARAASVTHLPSLGSHTGQLAGLLPLSSPVFLCPGSAVSA